jgi:hypothetical protein
MAVEQLKNLIGVIRKDPSRAPDGQYDQVSEGKTSVVADMYNLDFKDKRALAEVCHAPKTCAVSLGQDRLWPMPYGRCQYSVEPLL